jgi:hypothetical protein
MSSFLNPHVNYFICDFKKVINILKVHHESFFKKNQFIFYNMIPIKLHNNMDN